MQTAPINGKIKHLVCPDCLKTGLANDPRLSHPDSWVEEHLCHTHFLSNRSHKSQPSSKQLTLTESERIK